MVARKGDVEGVGGATAVTVLWPALRAFPGNVTRDRVGAVRLSQALYSLTEILTHVRSLPISGGIFLHTKYPYRYLPVGISTSLIWRRSTIELHSNLSEALMSPQGVMRNSTGTKK